MKQLLPLLLVWSMISFGQPNHKLWTDVLISHVSSKGIVDYQGIYKNPEQLNRYISSLQTNTPNEKWTKSDVLAYWINAYNALTIDLILRHYPVKSIKDIKKPWDQKLWQFNKEWLSLNDIEHKILRKLDEPRIHFAIVCASVSCPILQNEAFTAEQIEEQLNRATITFINDTSKNEISKDTLVLSKIFKWFTKDFKVQGGVVAFVNKYTEIDISTKPKTSYLDYNWDLND